jgi:dsRNA-specific ribonuclease
MRQIRAYLKGESATYTKEELEAMAVDLNEKAELRKEERSEGFKQAVVAHAERALERGTVHRLADHEMAQAIALTARGGELPAALVEELINRLDNATVTDKITDRMLITLTPKAWSKELREAFVRWVTEAPTRANHLLLHGKQSEWLAEVDIASSGEATSFTGLVRVACADGRAGTFSGTAPRKKDAEQVACVKAVLWLVGVTREEAEVQQSPARAKITGNPKGTLLEYCQKRGWPAPEFVGTGKGPSHAMLFSCRVTLRANGASYDRSVSGAANKKEAEAMASAELLDALGVAARAEKPTRAEATATVDLQNPIGSLQELAQKSKARSPEYTFESLSVEPPRFRAIVRTELPVPGEYRGEASTKQDAKKIAALAALKAG